MSETKECSVGWVIAWFMFEKISNNYEVSEEMNDQYTKDKNYGGIELRVIHSWKDMREDCDYHSKNKKKY